MCEVISAVASAEKEAIQVQWLRKVLERVAGGPDKRINQQKLLNRKALHGKKPPVRVKHKH